MKFGRQMQLQLQWAATLRNVKPSFSVGLKWLLLLTRTATLQCHLKDKKCSYLGDFARILFQSNTIISVCFS